MDFSTALDARVDTFEKPPTLPMGTYTWSVAKVPTVIVTAKGDWNVIEFSVRGVSAEDDVDQDDLAAFGGAEAAANKVSFMATTEEGAEGDAARKKALYQARMFCETTLQVDVEEGATLREVLDAAMHCQFMAQAIHAPSTTGDDVYVNLKGWAPLD